MAVCIIVSFQCDTENDLHLNSKLTKFKAIRNNNTTREWCHTAYVRTERTAVKQVCQCRLGILSSTMQTKGNECSNTK